MHPKTVFTTLTGFTVATVATASTTTPSGYEPASDVLLGLFYNGSTSTVEPSSHFAIPDVASEPSIGLKSKPDSVSTFVGIMVDLDVRYPGDSHNTTFLHWLVQDLVVDNQTTDLDDNFKLGLRNTSGNLATYIGPLPNPGEGDHRYVFYVFSQPDNFSLSGAPDYNDFDHLENRLFFNLTGSIAEHALGEPLAANYILVANGADVTAANTTTTSSLTNSMAAAAGNVAKRAGVLAGGVVPFMFR